MLVIKRAKLYFNPKISTNKAFVCLNNLPKITAGFILSQHKLKIYYFKVFVRKSHSQ